MTTYPAMPGAPVPVAISPLMRQEEGGCFAFGLFKAGPVAVEVTLRGRAHRSPGDTVAQRLASDRIGVQAGINGFVVGGGLFCRYDVAESRPIVDPTAWSSHSTEVSPEHQRMGVGSAIYGMMKACGFRVLPASAILPAGRNLWRRLDPDIQFSDGHEPPCADRSLMAACAAEFAPWPRLRDRVTGSQSLADLAALGPEVDPYLAAVGEVPAWSYREENAVWLFRQGAWAHYQGDEELERRYLLREAELPRLGRWRRLFTREQWPVASINVLDARDAAWSALRQRDDQERSSRFSDFAEERKRWTDRVRELRAAI